MGAIFLWRIARNLLSSYKFCVLITYKIDIDLLQMILVVNVCVVEKLCPVRKMMAGHFLGQGIVGCNGCTVMCNSKLAWVDSIAWVECISRTENWDELQVNVILSIDGINIRPQPNENWTKKYNHIGCGAFYCDEIWGFLVKIIQ